MNQEPKYMVSTQEILLSNNYFPVSKNIKQEVKLAPKFIDWRIFTCNSPGVQSPVDYVSINNDI